MTNLWQRKVKELTVWKGFTPSPKIEEIYCKALAFLMQSYEQIDGALFNQFDGLTKIVWTRNKTDLPCSNAAGCA